jgi:hypothetical protein
MGKFMGFHNWFLVSTLCLGIIFNFMVFQFRRFDIAGWIVIIWLILMIVEFKLLELEEEMWKQRVFS